MSEYIGSRISLISKSDIRYVGTLHEINSENSTVALENVKSFGTEGRKGSPEDEVAPSDSTYEYIVFRGSDVKDLRIEEMSKENAQPPQVPNDPAILGSGSRPMPPPQNYPQPPPSRQNQPPPFQQQPPFQPPFTQYQNQRFGGPPGGPYPGYHGPPPGGFPNMPYGAPPGWGPPPGQGFPPQHGPFSPSQHQQMPFGAPGLQMPPRPGQAHPSPAPSAAKEAQQQQPPVELSQATGHSQNPTPAPPALAKQGPPPPVESKPDLAAAAAPPAPASSSAPPKPNTTAPASKVALPLANPAAKAAAKPAPAVTPMSGTGGPIAPKPAGEAASQAALQYQNATKAATAAVAAAMAKLPTGPAQSTTSNRAAYVPNTSTAMDNLTQKVNDMRTDDKMRHGRNQGHGGYAERGQRGGRGGPGSRGGRGGKTLEVPKTDFDFEKANAEFKKKDVAEPGATATAGVAGGQVETNGTGNGVIGAHGDAAADDDVIIPPAPQPLYNKSSFFDNLSSEASERQESPTGIANGTEGGRGGRGGQFRRDERNRNFETFGAGSVDGAFRGGYRGRRGGRGFRGGQRGYGQGRGRGGVAGGVEA